MGVVGTVLLALTLSSACTPPTLAAPQVSPQPLGRGIDPTVDVAPSVGCTVAGPTSLPVGRSVLRVSWQGRTRVALLAVPDHDGLAPMPLLVSLHPFTLDPASWEALSGLADAALARGYVAVTPLGSQPGPRWAVPGGLATGTDDLGFLSALLDAVEDGLCVDRNREFAAGYSAGAAMAQALSCTMPWRFAAVAGSGGVNLTSLCPASPPTDVFVLHGTADTIAPLTGSQVPFATPLGLPVADVVATDAARAGCDPTPTTSTPVAGVEALTFEGCDDDRRVQYWKMLGAGHAWAGASTSLVGLFVGHTPKEFSATEAVLDVFGAT
jgi:polyhydroxybutyrate depolymerase